MGNGSRHNKVCEQKHINMEYDVATQEEYRCSIGSANSLDEKLNRQVVEPCRIHAMLN